jgi:uncharacterized membrane protein (DUF485 family)
MLIIKQKFFRFNQRLYRKTTVKNVFGKVPKMISIINHGMSRNKSRRIKHELQAEKKRMRTISTLITLAIIVSLIVVISFYLANSSTPAPSSITENDADSLEIPLKAALIDALYVTLPNERFTKSITEILRNAGFEVDVFQGSQVTIDFLKDVPNGYDLIILRMHSALEDDDLYLFTAEPYSIGKYTQEQHVQIVKEAYATDPQPVFAVNWGFIKKCMTGTFNGTLVIAMGCDGIRDSAIINEIMKQGAVGYISWTGPVLLSHSDTATLHLAESLYNQDLSITEAVQKTNNQVGSDPEWGTILQYELP